MLDPVRLDQPVAGYYKTRLCRGGPWVPVVIRYEVTPDPYFPENIMDRGAVWSAEVAGEPVDVFDAWPLRCDEPIAESEFNYLMALAEWAEDNAPDAPEAQPRQAIDLHNMNPLF
jgi:hypothetical protein